MYEVKIYANGEWTRVALFEPAFYSEAEEFAYYLMYDAEYDAQNVAIVDPLTDNVLWDAVSADQYEPADIDSDCGFDPYLGCFTDDC